MTHTPDSRDGHAVHPAAITALLTTALVVLLVAFAWPAVRSGFTDIPLGVAGPAPAAEQIEAQLAQARPGAFDVTTYPDAAAARAAIEDREVYGAVVAGADGVTVLTASAASPAIATGLTALASGLAESGVTVAVQDVVPLPTEDPRGAGLAAGALPLALGGVVVAAALTRAVASLGRRLLTAGAVSIAAGLALAGVLQGWLGALAGSYWLNSAVIALGLAAVSLTLIGLQALFGWIGFGLGAATVVLLGNPLSGVASAPEMLPAGWGDLGQLLPPGATGTALRSVAFFDGAGATTAVVVLVSWCLLGLALAGLAALRGRPGDRAAAYRADMADTVTVSPGPQ